MKEKTEESLEQNRTPKLKYHRSRKESIEGAHTLAYSFEEEFGFENGQRVNKK